LIATAQVTPLRTLRPEVPLGVEAVAARCLEKNRDERFANVAELAQALAPFAPERSFVSIERSSRILNVPGGAPPSRFERTPPRSSSATAVPGPGQPPTMHALPWRQTATASNFGQTANGPRSRRKLITAAGVAIALSIASIAALLTFGRGTPQPQAAAAPPASVAPAAPPPVATPAAPPAAFAPAPTVALAPPPTVEPTAPGPTAPPVRRVSHPPPAARASAQAAPGRPPPTSTPEAPGPGQKAAYEDM
jgi:serine/threonine-protein kinase